MADIPAPKHCPFLDRKCIQFECEQWQHVYGKDPQTEKIIDHFGCSFAWLPTLLIENTQAQNHTTATVDKLREEVATPPEMRAVLDALPMMPSRAALPSGEQ